jgi:hypothetical protein
MELKNIILSEVSQTQKAERRDSKMVARGRRQKACLL